MNSTKVIIATAIILFISNFLTGCSSKDLAMKPAGGEETRVYAEDSIKRISDAREVTKTASIRLEKEQDGRTLRVKILIDNPEGRAITSVQSWLSYNPKALKGVKIDTANSAFELMAPYDNTFDEVNGLVKIGRSSSEPVSDKLIEVAQAEFDMDYIGSTFVDFYDYQNDLTGHTSANVLQGETPFNVLMLPESPALVIEQ
jgi:hypothetical protein